MSSLSPIDDDVASLCVSSMQPIIGWSMLLINKSESEYGTFMSYICANFYVSDAPKKVSFINKA